MRVFKNIAELKPLLLQKKEMGCTLGFVPTMGALHKGHLSLIEQALLENDFVIISIFVNPTQFNNAGDFEKYPRIVTTDLELLAPFEENAFIYIPEIKDMYPNGASTLTFNFGGIEKEMEGKFRTGHFDGVGTILKTFFEQLQPNKAYFGEKDFQQLQIVKKLVVIENLPVKIIGCPIYREPSGLAMSSRNKRLSDNEAISAAILFQILSHVRKNFGINNANELRQWVANQLKDNPDVALEYFEIANETTLKPMESFEKDTKYRAFIAAFVGDVRLIDNLSLN